MKHVVCMAMVSLFVSDATAKDLSVQTEGKSVTVDARSINHEIVADDSSKGNRDNVLGCSFLVYSLLAKGDIQSVAAMSTDPKGTTEKWTTYRNRVGAEEFKKSSGEYFTSKNVVIAEIVIGDASMLIVKTADYTAGQMYVKRDGKWFCNEDLKSESSKVLGQVLRDVQDEKIRF